MADPSLLPRVSRRKKDLKKPVRPAVALPGSIPIHIQLGREHLDGLRGEISAAEPVLTNVYDDISLFQARDAALNDIMELLVAMRNCVDIVVAMRSERDFIKGQLDSLIKEMDRLVHETRHRNMALLQPVEKIAPLPGSGSGNIVDIVFIIDRDPWVRKEAEKIAKNIGMFYGKLINHGLKPMFGVQPFERYSQSSGPLRSDPRLTSEEIMSIYFKGETRNSLTAIAQAVSDQNFRQDSKKILVLVCNGEPADDFGEIRNEALSAVVASGATFYVVSVNNEYTSKPHAVYREIIEATSGECFSFEKMPVDVVLEKLSEAIVKKAFESGVQTFESQERNIVIGPGPSDTLNLKFPDMRTSTLGLSDLPLNNEEDFMSGLSKIQSAISLVSGDRIEKNIFLNYLARIIKYFDDARSYRLDFKV